MEAKQQEIDFAPFMHKNRLQEYAQKLGKPIPAYHTNNEGDPHAPQFRATVVVDGVTVTSTSTFAQRKAAEQDVAKLALDILSSRAERVGFPLTQEDMIFLKSIVHEYHVKMNLEKPTYTTSQVVGNYPAFTSSLFFNGQTYTGVLAKSKKEAEQLAARALIESVLANPDTRAAMGEIIRSKRKRSSASSKKGITSALPTEINVPLCFHVQNNSTLNNPNDTINGKYGLVDSTNNCLPVGVSSQEDEIAKGTATKSFTPEAEKSKEGYTCELSCGPIGGNGSSQPTCQQNMSLAAITSSIHFSDGSLAHVEVYDDVKNTEPSTKSEDSPAVILTSGMKRSDNSQNGGNESKKGRFIEQAPDST